MAVLTHVPLISHLQFAGLLMVQEVDHVHLLEFVQNSLIPLDSNDPS